MAPDGARGSPKRTITISVATVHRPSEFSEARAELSTGYPQNGSFGSSRLNGYSTTTDNVDRRAVALHKSLRVNDVSITCIDRKADWLQRRKSEIDVVLANSDAICSEEVPT